MEFCASNASIIFANDTFATILKGFFFYFLFSLGSQASSYWADAKFSDIFDVAVFLVRPGVEDVRKT
jgi:hypothetical protein